MKLELFKIIDETLMLYANNLEMYEHIRSLIQHELLQLLKDESECILGFQSRIKTKESLREKIVRNRYYVKYSNAQDIIASLSDVIGCRIDCRFLKDEKRIVKRLQEVCIFGDGQYKRPYENSKLALDVTTPQPQTQKNGLEIYRFDGIFEFENQLVRFELQVKSMVNAFWGTIEHRLIYKNHNYLDVDDFLSNILISINHSLNVLDRQLNIVHDRIESVSDGDSEMNEKAVKLLISRGINDLFSKKMNESLGFSLSIKHTCQILADYLFNNNIIGDKSTRELPNSDRLAQFLNLIRRLYVIDLDFEAPILFEYHFQPENYFQEIFGNHLLNQINQDYDWYVFFKMLFALEPGNNAQDFKNFLTIIERSILDQRWFNETFQELDKVEAKDVQLYLYKMLVDSLVHPESKNLVGHHTASEINTIYQQFIRVVESETTSLNDFKSRHQMYEKDWNYIINQIFNHQSEVK